MSPQGKNTQYGTTDRQMFLEKAARSIAELQPKIATLAETVVFLEVLGYTNKMASDHGFQDLADLSRHVLQFTRYYDKKFADPAKPLLPIPSIARRTAEAFGVAYPWVTSYAILLIFGVSLWLAQIMPLDMTTAFVVGIYSGLLISGGMSSFGRLFSFYDGQANLSQVRRILKRFYLLLETILLFVSLGIFSSAYLLKIPYWLISISLVSAATLSVHMASYMIIYNRRKIRVIIYSYSAGLAALLSVYFLTANFFPAAAFRYFYALGAALAVLSIPSVYYHYKIFRAEKTEKRKENEPNFYSPVSSIRNTINSRFSVQFWEILPFFVNGMLFFCILFGDRVISWIYNPVHYVNGISFPMVFNTTYHAGADSALIALFPSLIIQYAMLSPLHAELHNLSLDSRISEMKRVQQFLSAKYKKMIVTTIVATIVVVGLMILLEPSLMIILRGSTISSRIFDIAAISNVFMAIFAGNGMFLTFMNKIKTLCLVGAIGATFVAGAGLWLGMSGFENIVYAYLGETIILATLTSVIVARNLSRVASIQFARFV
ncbi:MAG: hypothetical protein JRN15_18835 [Nitrososphaerota archaeon]|nr:hypothetical protein [Nitrososphaerota archaeon]